jgi:hypothetical protein
MAMAMSKGRLPLMQLVVAAVMLLMVFVVVYMYRIIDDLHRDQQVMRLQLAELTGTRYASGPAGGKSEDFLVPRPPAAAASRRQLPSDLHAGPQGPEAEEEEYYRSIGEGAHGGISSGGSKKSRKLMGLHSTGRTANVGCFEIDDTSPTTLIVSGNSPGCNYHTCPDCFVTPAVVSQDITLTINDCSSALWTRGLSRTGVWVYTFINTDSTYTLTVEDNSGSGITYNVPPLSHVQAYCASTLGTANRLVFPSLRLPTLIVDSGLTLSAGNFDASGSTGTFTTNSGTNTLSGNTVISGSKTFTTGTGAVSLNGATTVDDGTTFTVGSAAAGGASTLYGNVQIGGSGTGESVTTTIYGDVTQAGESSNPSATGAQFTTGIGAVTLNGDVTVAQDKNLHMTHPGAGTFQTGSGTITFNGDGIFPSAQTFETGTGTITIRGNTELTSGASLTVGSAGSAGSTTLYGNVQIGGAGNGESASTQIYGNFAQGDDPSGSGSTFSTGIGAISLNGDTTLAAGKDLVMTTGSGSFQTAQGDVNLNGNVLIANTKTFSTGEAATVDLNGPTTIGDTYPFSVGSVGNGGTSHFNGAVTVGDSSQGGASRAFTVYGDVTFADDTDGTVKTFDTGTGQITLNGNVDVAAGKSFMMLTSAGGGQFQTGLGAVSINGPTTVAAGSTFTLNDYPSPGPVAIQCNKNPVSDDTLTTYCTATR